MKLTMPKSGVINLAQSFEYTYWKYARMIWAMALSYPFYRFDLVWGPDHLFLVFATGMSVYVISRFIFLMPVFNFIDRNVARYEVTLEVPDEPVVVTTDPMV